MWNVIDSWHAVCKRVSSQKLFIAFFFQFGCKTLAKRVKLWGYPSPCFLNEQFEVAVVSLFKGCPDGRETDDLFDFIFFLPIVQNSTWNALRI